MTDLNQMDTPQLRDEYRRIRSTTFLFTHGTYAEFDGEVKQVMSEKCMEFTPVNYVKAADMVMTETLQAVEESLLDREYDGDGVGAMNDMGYDTLEERNMDREWE